jgi:hypothetical protein
MTRPTTVRSDPRVALAHHEAGHAVAAYWLGKQLEIVSIVSNERADGFVMGEGTDWFQADLKVLDDATRRSVAADIIVYLAGPLCEEAIGVPPKNLVYDETFAQYFPASDLGRSCRLLELVLATVQERERYLATCAITLRDCCLAPASGQP